MIEAIVYINLLHRTDRNASILKILSEYEFDESKIHRIDAVLNTMCGHIGCGESHIKALELAIKNNWDETLILEDDFIFIQPVDVVKKTLSDLQSVPYDVVLLAEGHKNVKQSDYSFLNKIISCSTCSGYIIKRHYYETLLNNFRESVRTMNTELLNHIKKCTQKRVPITKLHYCSAIDQYWFRLQQKDTFYLLSPCLGTQDCGYSDNNCSPEYQNEKIETA